MLSSVVRGVILRNNLRSCTLRQCSRFSTLNFDDSKAAFKSKTTREIFLAVTIFKICSIPYFVSNAARLLAISRSTIGESATRFLVRNTFFQHFCAGENGADIRPKISNLESQGIYSILDFAAENDKAPEEVIGSGIQSREYSEEIEEKECDANVEIFLECIRAASQFEDGFAAIKVTGLGRPVLLEAVANVVGTVRKRFLELDVRGKQCLNFEEFYQGVRKLGVLLDEKQAKELFSRFDYDGDGEIDILEWTEYLKVEDL